MNTGALNLLSSACTTNMATVNTVENSTGNGSEGRSVSTNSTGFLSVIAQINQVAQMHEKESSNSDTDANGAIPEHEASTCSESVINPATNVSSCPLQFQIFPSPVGHPIEMFLHLQCHQRKLVAH